MRTHSGHDVDGVAGGDIEVARYYPEDQEYLLEFEPSDPPSSISGAAARETAISYTL